MACCFKRVKLSENAIRTIESVVFIIIIVIVIGLFTLPIIFNYVKLVQSELPSVSSVSNDTSSSFNSTSSQTADCKIPLSWGQYDSTDCIEYTGTICKSFLSQWSLCTTGEGSELVHVDVPTQSLQEQHESQIYQLNIFLSNYIECQEVALPFLCQFYYPLNDCSTGKSFTASKEDCILISTGVCADLWQLAIRFGYGASLPNCYYLPNASSNDTSLSNHVLINETTNSTVDLPCRDDFIRINSICEPRCDSFSQWSHADSLFVLYSEVIATVVGFIIVVIVLILSIKDYKTMLTYPSILVFVQVIDLAVLALLLIITSIDRNGLYCSSVSLLKTLDNPTPFCTFSGVIYHYCFMNMLLWWFFNVVVFFHKVMFPFHANRLQKLNRNKYIFAAIAIISTLLPIPVIIVCLAVKKYNYKNLRFPVTVCVSLKEIGYYSLILPYDVLMSIGLCLIIIVFWNIRRKSNLFSKKHSTQLSVAEKKIIFIFASFLILGIFILCLDNYSDMRTDQFTNALTQYFACEAGGYVQGKCNRDSFTQIYSPFMFAMLYFFLGFMPLSIFNFVVKWSSIKKAITATRKFSQTYSVRLARRFQNSSSNKTTSENIASVDQVLSSNSPVYSKDIGTIIKPTQNCV